MSLFDDISDSGSSGTEGEGVPLEKDAPMTPDDSDKAARDALLSLRYAPGSSRAAPPTSAAAGPSAAADVGRGQFGSAMADMQRLRRLERERVALERQERRRAADGRDAELAAKDKTVGVFVTAAYKESLQRHTTGAAAASKTPSSSAPSATEAHHAEEDPLAAYMQDVERALEARRRRVAELEVAGTAASAQQPSPAVAGPAEPSPPTPPPPASSAERAATPPPVAAAAGSSDALSVGTPPASSAPPTSRKRTRIHLTEEFLAECAAQADARLYAQIIMR